MNEDRSDIDAFALEQLCVHGFECVGGEQPLAKSQPDAQVVADVGIVDRVDLRSRDVATRIGQKAIMQTQLGIRRLRNRR